MLSNSPHTFLLALKRDVKKSMKIYIKSSSLTGNYSIAFENVIVIFFHTTYSKIILKISFCTIDNLTIK